MKIRPFVSYKMKIGESGAGELAAKVNDKHHAPLDLPGDVGINEVAQKKNLYINSLDVSFNPLTYNPDKPLHAQGLDLSLTLNRPLDRLRVQFLNTEISPKHLIELAKFIRLHKNSIKNIEISLTDSSSQNNDARIIKPLINAIEETKNLHTLRLNFNSSYFNSHSPDFEALKCLGRALRSLHKLEDLEVDVGTNSFSQNAFDALFYNLSYTPKLKSIVFGLDKSWRIDGDDFCKYMADLRKLPCLEELTLYLGHNLGVDDKVIDVLCASLRNLPNLRMLSIDIDRIHCAFEGYKKIDETVKSLENVSFKIPPMRDEIRLANHGAEDEATPALVEAANAYVAAGRSNR